MIQWQRQISVWDNIGSSVDSTVPTHSQQCARTSDEVFTDGKERQILAGTQLQKSEGDSEHYCTNVRPVLEYCSVI